MRLAKKTHPQRAGNKTLRCAYITVGRWPVAVETHLDDGVSTGGCFHGSSAALSLVVCSVVGFGVHLDLQLELTVLVR